MKEQILQELIKPFLGLKELNVGSINQATNQMVGIFNNLVKEGYLIVDNPKPVKETPKKKVEEPSKSKEDAK